MHNDAVPFFSICIPQYNRTSFLILALRALAQQTFKNFEVCVSDDCSTDGRQGEVGQALQEFGLRHVFRRQPKNVGYDGNLRAAISLASGCYCFLLGNDDCLADANALERLSALIATEGKTGVVITNYMKQSDGTISRRVPATRIVGSGPSIAANCFRNMSFVSGIVLRRDRALVHATSKWDGAEMYQMYLGSRIISEGYDLMEVDDVIVLQGIQVPGEVVDSYAARPRLHSCSIQERKIPLVQMGRLVVDAIEPYAQGTISGLSTSVFFQILIFPYAFWIVEYRRVQSWNYSLSICLGMRPRNLFGNMTLDSAHSVALQMVYLGVTLAGLITPIALFDVLRSNLYAVAKSAFHD